MGHHHHHHPSTETVHFAICPHGGCHEVLNGATNEVEDCAGGGCTQVENGGQNETETCNGGGCISNVHNIILII